MGDGDCGGYSFVDSVDLESAYVSSVEFGYWRGGSVIALVVDCSSLWYDGTSIFIPT